MSLSFPIVNAYLKAIPLYILYLLGYFLVLKAWNFIIKKNTIETLHLGS